MNSYELREVVMIDRNNKVGLQTRPKKHIAIISKKIWTDWQQIGRLFVNLEPYAEFFGN